MFKQIKKLFIALVLVFSLCLVACGEECPECEVCEKCPDISDLIHPDECPKTEFNANTECPANGYIKPEDCPTSTIEGYKAPTSVEFYSEEIKVGESVKFELEVSPADAYQGLVWSSSDPSIATVDAEGNITGVRPGVVTITAASVLDSSISFEDEEVEVVEEGLAFDIVEREKNKIVAELTNGYATEDFELPTPWNQNVVVTYNDADGKEISKFVMPTFEEGVTSKNVNITGTVSYGDDGFTEFSATVKCVKAVEGEKNDYEKVDFAVEVAEAFLYQYINGSEKVTGDIYLPSTIYGVSLGWTTNKAYVLTNAGEFTRPNNDSSVTYTITPKCGAASRSETFTVVAAGYTKSEKIDYLLNEGSLKGINKGSFAGSVALPEKDDKFGIHLTYVSADKDTMSNDGVVSTTLYKDTKVKFTVTAIYDDANYTSDAFVEVFEIELTAQGNGTASALADFINAKDAEGNVLHAQLKHVPYGMGNSGVAGKEEITYVLNETEAANYTDLKFVADENFKVNYVKDSAGKDTTVVKSIELVTQYFRYHEAKIVVSKGNASYTWTLNVGIGAVQDICYIGGRSHSLQASANPTERGDMLQGFSKWDNYVGIVSNNSERTTGQYWSEFSGYTMYVDTPAGVKETVFTKDADGKVTVKALDADKTVRQQIFFMEFAVVHMDAKVMWADTDGDGLGDEEVYLPVVSEKKYFDTIRTTYGGNFGTLFVNESAYDLELPVSALSMGGTFADGEAMKTYTKSSISLSKKEGKAVAEIKDDYGSALKVSREQTWAFDGYRPGFVVAPENTGHILAEGESAAYKFTVGSQQAADNEGNNGTYYIQYAVSSELSALWGTPYVEVAQGGLAMAFHSQTLYSLAKAGGYGISGLGNLKATVERYYRHAENEEISDYVVNDIQNYLIKLVDGASELSGDALTKALADAVKNNGEGIAFNDISVDTLEEIVALKDRYEALRATWKEKAAVKTAGERIAAIIEAAKVELAKQESYAVLTENSFIAVKSELAKANIAIKTKTVGEGADAKVVNDYAGTNDAVYAILTGSDMDAKIAAAKRNYEALTEGQKSLYINGFEEKYGLKFDARSTAWILDVYELECKIAELSLTVTDPEAVLAVIEEVEELIDPEDSSAVAVPTSEFSQWSQEKLRQLGIVANALTVKDDYDEIEDAEEAYDAQAALDESLIYLSFKSYEVTDVKTEITTDGDDVFFANKRKAAKTALENKLATLKTLTATLAKAIKDGVDALPTAAQFKKGEYTEENLTLLAQLYLNKENKDKGIELNKYDQLVNAYIVLHIAFGTYDSLAKVEGSTEIDATKMLVAGFNKMKVEVAETTGVITVKYLDKNGKETTDSTKYVVDSAYGSFNAKGENDKLTKLYNSPSAYDEYIANIVIDEVENLPVVGKITLEDEAAVKAAQSAYDALTTSQKAFADKYQSTELVTYIPNRLSELATKLVSLKQEAAIAPVNDAIDALPISSKITLEDKEAVEAAEKLYDALSAELQSKVASDATTKLSAARTALNTCITNACTGSKTYKAAIDAFKGTKLSDTVTTDTAATAEKLIETYDAMSDMEKAYFETAQAGYYKIYTKIYSALQVYNQYAK